MTERKEIEPYLLTPEYWDGHEPGDNCEPLNGMSLVPMEAPGNLRTNLKAERFARKRLKRFLSTSGKTPIQFLGKGDVFDANEFSEGTIIQVFEERMSIRSQDGTFYRAEKYWGVTVAGTDGKIQQIRRYEDEPSPFFGVQQEPSIKVGEVEHSIRNRALGVTDRFGRVTKVVVYEAGSGVKEKAKRKSKQHGVLFHKPRRA